LLLWYYLSKLLSRAYSRIMNERLNDVPAARLLTAVARALSAALGMEGRGHSKPKPVTLNAHLLPKHMHHNRAEIEAAEQCGCISCEQMFQRGDIRRWVAAGTTAVCPRCNIAAVVGSGAGFALTPQLLRRAHQLLFEGLGLSGQFLERSPAKEKALRSVEAPNASGDVRKSAYGSHPALSSPAGGVLPSN
jgi:hypothetical protein